MANRRFGGGGPPQKLGGFPQQNFQGNKVNPWQGGAAPNNALNSGLLSQLSAPQAQLALALSSLLQNQQPMNNNPPSLLSLPTTPAFNNQDNFGSQNRFNNRGRDFRRPEPYNKNNQGRSGNAPWRDNSTRPSNIYGGNRSLSSSGRNNSRSNFGGKDRKSPPKGGKFNRNDNKPQASGKPANKGTKPGDKVSESSKKPQKDDSLLDDSREEDGSETKEKKRDWKQEKNTDDQDADEEKKGPDGSADSVDLTEEGAVDDDRKDKKPREGRYYGVPASLLHCFVCNKSMWDGESFQNHIRGKAHKQMMDSLGQSFQITVNILRENMRLVEEKKMIELERIHRNSRNFHRQPQEPQSHCNMCDLKFLGKIISHRKTEGHQRLKRFLHPKCDYCTQEFPSRMEWVDHRFTPDHLRKIKEILDNTSSEEGDGAPIAEESPELDNDPLLEEGLQTEDENPVLELTDDLKDLQNRIPAYKPSREVAKKNVQPMSGFYCDICVRFMTSEAAAQEHLRTEKHYNSFVESAKRQYKRMNEEAAAEESSDKKRKTEEADEPAKKAKKDDDAEGGADDAEEGATGEGDGDEMYDPEEACEDNEGSLDNAVLDEEFAEVDRLIKTVEQETKEEAKEEEEDKEDEKKPSEATVSPRGRRTGAVRNGAGPRSKTRRGGRGGV